MERFHTILIKDFMTKDPFVLTMGEPMADAYEKMHDYHIRHLPVVDEKGNLAEEWLYSVRGIYRELIGND